MRNWIKNRRCFLHRVYVSKRMSDLQQEIFRDCMATGKVNLEKRQQLLKYKEHLKNL